jgi:tetratricopeptide (TPR) repeat protein
MRRPPVRHRLPSTLLPAGASARRGPLGPGLLLALALATPALGADRGSTLGEVPAAGEVLLVSYVDDLLKGERKEEDVRSELLARFREEDLGRFLKSGDAKARRAALVALGLTGGWRSNAAVALALKDRDEFLREFAVTVLWAIWFRADTAENNAALRQVADLIQQRRLEEAIDRASRLVERAPDFAEAYNQRAIAEFFLGRFADSANDCREALKRNPYHIGALGGLAQCCDRLDQPAEQLKAYRRSLELQPYNQGLRDLIADLETKVGQ